MGQQCVAEPKNEQEQTEDGQGVSQLLPWVGLDGDPYSADLTPSELYAG